MLLGLCPPGVCHAQTGRASAPIVISVDARAPWKYRIPVQMKMSAPAGPLTLVFPRWLPGMHSMQGSLGNFARLNITADGAPLVWNRDPFDAFLIHLNVPAGTQNVEAILRLRPCERDGR